MKVELLQEKSPEDIAEVCIILVVNIEALNVSVFEPNAIVSCDSNCGRCSENFLVLCALYGALLHCT